ncbi:hypothetical protein GLOIN_2v1771116 [Rhizophagus irregularis DAOM 181602=DAOM 197198]|nr:hypothetical protein GLOIN_2v1771116 [Rhizophagus irregularis DAOM 181602=DAOM 197198]
MINVDWFQPFERTVHSSGADDDEDGGGSDNHEDDGDINMSKLTIKRNTRVNDGEIIVEHIEKYGGHFGKVIRINKIKYILIYFNNENEMMNTIYKSAMEDKLGAGFQIKSQDELIMNDGKFRTRRILKTK